VYSALCGRSRVYRFEELREVAAARGFEAYQGAALAFKAGEQQVGPHLDHEAGSLMGGDVALLGLAQAQDVAGVAALTDDGGQRNGLLALAVVNRVFGVGAAWKLPRLVSASYRPPIPA